MRKFTENGAAGPLALIRIILGLMFLWAFFDKLLGLGLATPDGQGWLYGYSPSQYYLVNVDGWFAGLFNWLGGMYQICDVLLMAGLLVLGVTLTLGIAKKATTILTIIIMFFFMLTELPPSTNPVLEYHMVYILALIAIYLGDGFSMIGLESRWGESALVRRFPILE